MKMKMHSRSNKRSDIRESVTQFGETNGWVTLFRVSVSDRKIHWERSQKKERKKDGDWTSFGIDLFLYVDRYISSICSLLGHARNVFLCFHVFLFLMADLLQWKNYQCNQLILICSARFFVSNHLTEEILE